MSHHHAIRITLPYADCSGIISMWADRATAAIAYQHDADEEVTKTHVHLALWNCEVGAEALKRMWINCPGKGNEFWSWKPADILNPLDTGCGGALIYIGYMIAGSSTGAPVFQKNMLTGILETAKANWVEPVKADKTRGHSEHIIKKVLERFDIKIMSRYYRDDTIEIGQCKYNLDLLMDNVRTETFKILWGEKRMAPHASHYKIIASTVFLRICEDAKCFGEGVAAIKNLWY